MQNGSVFHLSDTRCLVQPLNRQRVNSAPAQGCALTAACDQAAGTPPDGSGHRWETAAPCPVLPSRAVRYDNALMLYMVIERYLAGPEPVYQRVAASGRMLPDGLAYLSSWVAAAGMDRCFQLMETDDPALFDAWTERWRDLVAFEIVPVVTSSEAAARARGA